MNLLASKKEGLCQRSNPHECRTNSWSALAVCGLAGAWVPCFTILLTHFGYGLSGDTPEVLTSLGSAPKSYRFRLAAGSANSTSPAPQIFLRTTHHLYLGVAYGQRTLVYPIVNGVPSDRPSRVVNYIGGLTQGQAVGPDGSIYVSRYVDGSYFLDIYPPTSESANVTEMRLTIHGGPITIDKQNYLYIGGYNTTPGVGEVQIYSPPPNRKLIRQFKTASPYAPFGLAVDDGGKLYIANDSRVIYEYDHLLTRPRLIRTFCTVHREWFVAVNEEGNILVGGGEIAPRPDGIAIFDEDESRCPAIPMRVLHPLGYPIAFAAQVTTAGDFAYSIMFQKGRTTGTLFAFATTRGRQKPLAVVNSPEGFGGYVAVGP